MSLKGSPTQVAMRSKVNTYMEKGSGLVIERECDGSSIQTHTARTTSVCAGRSSHLPVKRLTLFFKRLHHFEIFFDQGLLDALPLFGLCLGSFGLANFSVARFFVLKKLIKPFLAVFFSDAAK